MGVGCNVRDLDEWKITDGACYLDWYPLGSEKGPEHAKYLVETFKPKAIVFCEKHGPNEVGYCHSVHGARIPPEEFANTWHLLDEAKKHGILTIGTGDGGNEIGNGIIYEYARRSPLRQEVPVRLRRRHGHGLQDRHLLCGRDIELGPLRRERMLAYMLGDVDVMHTVDDERRMLEACAMGGSVDGMSMRPICRVDGVSMAGGQAFVTLLREIVSDGSASAPGKSKRFRLRRFGGIRR